MWPQRANPHTLRSAYSWKRLLTGSSRTTSHASAASGRCTGQHMTPGSTTCSSSPSSAARSPPPPTAAEAPAPLGGAGRRAAEEFAAASAAAGDESSWDSWLRSRRITWQGYV